MVGCGGYDGYVDGYVDIGHSEECKAEGRKG